MQLALLHKEMEMLTPEVAGVVEIQEMLMVVQVVQVLFILK